MQFEGPKIPQAAPQRSGCTRTLEAASSEKSIYDAFIGLLTDADSKSAKRRLNQSLTHRGPWSMHSRQSTKIQILTTISI